ncbi:hypothetical protein SFRURICE_001955 [Spodoptera frugiperda]|nr:hypothetical protein SFRURICE_001955 [Spodoptera frugiperda]
MGPMRELLYLLPIIGMAKTPKRTEICSRLHKVRCHAQIARDHTPRVCDGRIAHVATPLSNIGTMVNQRV